MLDYARSLQQLRLCIQRTNTFDAISAVLAVHQEETLWQEQYGYTNMSLDERIEAEIEQFGCIQKVCPFSTGRTGRARLTLLGRKGYLQAGCPFFGPCVPSGL